MDVGMTGEGKQAEKPSNEDDFLLAAQKRAVLACQAWDPVHLLAADDVRFRSGDQWPTDVKQEREDPTAPRPMLTINQLPKFERQVLGDGKRNRINIQVTPVEGDRGARVKNLAGTKDYTLAQVMEGLIRNIEYSSKAERAYDKALEHAVQGGFGWLRVVKRYSRPDGFEQELAIRGVRNRFSVVVDPAAMFSDEPDMASMRYGFVTSMVAKDELARRYGKEIVTDAAFVADSSIPHFEWWYQGDQARLAEYYCVEIEEATYLLLTDGRIIEWPKDQRARTELMAQWAAAGVRVARDRVGEKRAVKWSLLSGREILDGPFAWDGGYVPLVPVLGPELIVDGQVIYESLIRHAKDPQRQFNYWRTAAVEAVALAPKAPWIADMLSIQGFEKDYEQSSRRAIQLLKYRARENVPAPARVNMGSNIAAEIQQSMQSNDDLKGSIGIFDASIGQRSNETSGRAIIARQREADTGTYVWHDGLAKGVEHVGRILCDMAPKVYDTQRVARLRTPEGQDDAVMLNQTLSDGTKVCDLSAQRYDVQAATGPALSTQRLEAAEGMMAFVQAYKAAAPALADIIPSAMDWPEAQRASRRLRRMVPKELLDPTEIEELQNNQPPPPEPSPQEVATMALAAKETEAKAIGAEADLMNAQAKMAEAQALDPERVKELVAEALAEVLPVLLGRAPPSSGRDDRAT